MTIDRALSPADFARRYGIGVHKVLLFINANILGAVDTRSPGSTRPRWRITAQHVAQFEASRAAKPPAPKATRRLKTKKPANYIEYF